MAFRDLFTAPKPLIACIHLMPLPGSPRYAGTMREVYDTALAEAEIFAQYPIDGLIVENFRDIPFYPHALPAETIASRKGNATVAPIPRRNVRRGMCFPVMKSTCRLLFMAPLKRCPTCRVPQVSCTAPLQR